MAESTYIFIEGEPIDVGLPGDHDYTFSDGTPVTDSGKSPLVFESGTGLGSVYELAGEVAYVVGGRNGAPLVAYNPLTGERFWRNDGVQYQNGNNIDYHPSPDLVIVSGSGLEAYDSDSGSQVWNYSNTGRHATFVKNSEALIAHSNGLRRLVLRNPGDGSRIDDYPLLEDSNDEGDYIWSIATDGQFVYCISFFGEIAKFDVANRTVVERRTDFYDNTYTQNAPISTYPGTDLYAKITFSTSIAFYAFDKSDLSTKWSNPVKYVYPAIRPTLNNQYVYLGDGDSNADPAVEQYDLDGSLNWENTILNIDGTEVYGFNGVAPFPDGSGAVYSANIVSYGAAMAVDDTGAVLWEDKLDGVPEFDSDFPRVTMGGGAPAGDTLIDDFEDGNITTKASNWDGWKEDTGNFTAQTNTVLSGTTSGKLNSSATVARGDLLVQTERDAAFTPDRAELLIQMTNQTGDVDDNGRVYWNDTEFFYQGQTEFQGDGDIVVYDSTGANGTVIGTWSAGVTYKIIWDFDWSVPAVTISVEEAGGSVVGSDTKTLSGNLLYQVRVNNFNHEVIFDDVQVSYAGR